MPSFSTLLLFVGASALLLAFPGPAVIFLVTRSAEHGRAAGLVSLLGVETGTLLYALAATAGLAGVIGRRLAPGSRARRGLDRACGVVYAGLGVAAALSGGGSRHAAHG